MDIFQVSANSADAKPGKGSGETLVSPPSTYSALAAIPHWRRNLAKGDFSILPLTHQAELWEFVQGKGKTRRVDWEEMRSKIGLSTEGNLPKQAVEMESKESTAVETNLQAPPVKLTMKEKMAMKKAAALAEKAAKEKAAEEAAGASSVAAPPSQEEGAKAKTKTPKVKAAVKEAQAATITSLPESTFAADVGQPVALKLPEVAEEESQSTLHFCPTCSYYLYLQYQTSEADGKDTLFRLCRNCGYKEVESKGGLISEIYVQERSTESYKILLNEYTRRDPRLPHIRGVMKCPAGDCESNIGGKESDIIYMKYDGVNLLYLYICDVCGYRWHSRR